MIDKIFKAYDVRATYPVPLNEEMAWKVGHATAQYLKRSRQTVAADQRVGMEDTVIVGRDMRPSSPDLARALIDGIRSVGMNVIDIGMIDTSMIYFAINHYDAVGGIQTTASHNPIQYNGFKISGPKAKPIGAATGLDDIKRIATTLRVGQTGLKGNIQEMDVWTDYRNHVLQFMSLRRRLKVVVDASNGMAGKMVPAVFGGVRNLEIIPVLFEVTGSFVHDPNPLVESNLQMLKDKVAEVKPDLGVCFDGDADRCMFVDESGQTIGCDLITALLASDFLRKPENKGATIVYDLRSSHVVADEVRAAGGVPKRDRVGHAFIKKTMSETKAVFGGELSGHFYFRDNFYADSGAIAFARLLSVLSNQSGPISGLADPLRRYYQSGEINFQVEDKDAKIRELADAYKKAQIDYLDGVTIDLGILVVQHPQEQHRADASIESGNRVGGTSGREVQRAAQDSWRTGAWTLRTMPSRILVLSASVGAGHMRAAQAVELALREIAPQAEVKNVDVLTLTNAAFRKVYGESYLDLVNKAPHVLGVFYDMLDKPLRPRSKRDRLRLLVEKLNLSKFLDLLNDNHWDVVVNTHFLPAEIIASLRRDGKIAIRQITATTDFETHRLWVNEPCDHYTTATEEGAAYLRHWGVLPEHVTVTGIPIHPVFSKPKDRKTAHPFTGTARRSPHSPAARRRFRRRPD